MNNIFTKEFLENTKNYIKFISIYILIFITISMSIKYTLPFIVAFIIAIIINPISKYLNKVFKIDKGLSTLIISVFIIIIVLCMISLLLTIGIENLFELIKHSKLENISIYNNEYVIINNIYELINQYNRDIAEVSKIVLRKTLDVAISIPELIMFIITVFLSIYFIAKDMDKIENKFYNIFTDNIKIKVIDIKKQAGSSITSYIRAYIILSLITLFSVWIGFLLLKIPYSFIIAICASILDLIPFVGITIIFIPIIIYYFFMGEKFVCMMLLILFIFICIIRQIVEPKLISVSIGVNPFLSIVCMFIGVQIAGVRGVIFFIGMLIMHDILRKVRIL